MPVQHAAYSRYLSWLIQLQTAQSPLLPKPSTPLAPAGDRPGGLNAKLPLVSGSKPPPEGTQKSSSVSQAMSMLSEICARSGLQTSSLRSIKQHKRSAPANLTARPYSHHRKHAAQYSGHQRAGRTLDEKGYRPLRHEPRSKRLQGTENTNGTMILRQQENQGESFTKVITDLESLLKEALTIAGHAASREHSEDILLSPQGRQRGYGRIGSRGSVDNSECVSSLSGGADEEDNYTTLPIHHASNRQGHVSIDELSSNVHYHSHFKKARDATPCPAQTRHTSTVPNADEDQPKGKREGTHREFLELPRTSSKTGTLTQKSLYHQPFNPTDWAVIRVPYKPSKIRLEMGPTLPIVQVPTKEQHAFLQRGHRASESALTRYSVREYVNAHPRPPIEPRMSSIRLRKVVPKGENFKSRDAQHSDEKDDCTCAPYIADFKISGLQYYPVYQEAIVGEPSQAPRHGPHPVRPRQDTLAPLDDPEKHEKHQHRLKDRHHLSIREPDEFGLSRSHRHSPIV